MWHRCGCGRGRGVSAPGRVREVHGHPSHPARGYGPGECCKLVWGRAPVANAVCVEPPPPPPPPPPPKVRKNCTKKKKKNRLRLRNRGSRAQPICMFKAPINVPNAWLIAMVVLTVNSPFIHLENALEAPSSVSGVI